MANGPMKPRRKPTAEAITPTAASLLGFLHEGPLSGWDLVVKAEGTIGDFWNITKSQVYRELETLARMGYVGQGKLGVRARRPYSITALGRRAFVAWLEQAPGPLLMRWPLALTVFFGKHLEPPALSGFLKQHRIQHAALVATLSAFEPQLRTSGDEHVLAVLSLGTRFHALVVEWIDEQLAEKPRNTQRRASRTAPR
jgi:DNA-binding PadR family transcriptional regulator